MLKLIQRPTKQSGLSSKGFSKTKNLQKQLKSVSVAPQVQSRNLITSKNSFLIKFNNNAFAQTPKASFKPLKSNPKKPAFSSASSMSVSFSRSFSSPSQFISSNRVSQNSLKNSNIRPSLARTIITPKTGVSTHPLSKKMNFYAKRLETTVGRVPTMGDSIPDGVLTEFNKKVGDYVEADEIIGSIETDKVAVEIRAPTAGVITKVMAVEDEKVKVDQPIYEMDTSAEPPKDQAPKKSEAPKSEAPKAEASKSEAPKKAEASKSEPPKKAEAPKAAPKTSSTPSGPREHRAPMSRQRLRIAERLKESQNTYALLTTFNECDMSGLTEMKNSFKDEFFEKHGVKLGFMSTFLKASSVALQENPVMNAVIDGTDILYRDYVDISVAVATPTGLAVPVIRDVQDLSLAGLEQELVNLGNKARNKKLEIADMTGGTFTISNGGVYGSLMGTPIVNPPQSCILGMHGIFKRPVVRGNDVVIRPMMYLALTYDHRLIDGRDAVLFLRRIKDIVEDPRRLLIA